MQNVTVEGNTIRGNGGAAYRGAAILVHGDGAIGNRNIVIRDNLLLGNYQGDMDLQWVDGVALSGNVMSAPAQWPTGVKPYSPISLADCRNIALTGNIVKNASGYQPDMVATGENVTGVKQNDPSGIRAAAL